MQPDRAKTSSATRPNCCRAPVYNHETARVLLVDDHEVLRHLDTGLTSGEIASALHLSTSTVDTYRERIKAKFDLASAAELTHHATRWVLGQD